MSKSGFHLDRSVRVRNELRGRVDGIIASLVKFRETHEFALRRRDIEIYGHSDYTKLPQWAQSDVQAYYYGKLDMVSRYHTVFAYKALEDGKLYQTKTGWITAPDMPFWDDLQTRHGFFDDSMWVENGSYWPCGKPFSVYPNKYPKSPLLNKESSDEAA